MFPFNLNGPQFVVFYAAFAVAVIAIHAALHLRPGAAASAAGPPLDTLANDPYLVAALREGTDEAIRVAVVNLVDRGLLIPLGGGLRTSGNADPAVLRTKLDQAITRRCRAAPLSPADILQDDAVRVAAADLESHLRSLGLLMDPAAIASRAQARTAVLLLLAGVALARIVQALLAGRSNLMFLVIETFLACLIAYHLPKARLTESGQRALSALQTLLQRLKRRVDTLAPGGATNEAMLVAAMFGLYVLPAAAFPFVEQTFPRPKATDSGGSSSDGGDSSGCGGGGGCGGCGG